MSREKSKPRLRLARVLVGAAVTLAERRRGLLHAMALPAIMQSGYVIATEFAPAFAESAVVGFLILMIAMHILLAVNVHRLVLLGTAAVPSFGLGGWGLREWRYLGWWWLQWLGASFAALTLGPVTALGAPGYALMIAAAAWIAGRLSMMLPGIAIGRALEFRDAWRRGAGASVRLAVLAVGVPFATVLVLLPLGAAEILPVRLIGTLLSVGLSAWSVAALALAWQSLGDGTEGSGVPPDPDPRAPDRDLELEPDASRGVLRITVPRRFETIELGHLAAADGLTAYQGRIRGVVVEVLDAFTETDSADWHALDTLLSHLAVVSVHGAGVLRVALVAPTPWAPEVHQLRKHFPEAQERYFPALRLSRASSWASGEDDV